MVQRTTQAVPALLMTATVLVIALLPVNISWWALSAQSELYTRLTFHFFHVSFFHALINCWCILSLCILYKVKNARFIPSFIIATLTPDFAIAGHEYVVGLSAICFALMGITLVEKKLNAGLFAWAFASIALGLFFPAVCVGIHLYSLLAGMIVGFMFMPYKCKKT